MLVSKSLVRVPHGAYFFSTYYRSYPMGTILQLKYVLVNNNDRKIVNMFLSIGFNICFGAQKNSLCIPKTCLVEKIRKKDHPLLCEK